MESLGRGRAVAEGDGGIAEYLRSRSRSGDLDDLCAENVGKGPGIANPVAGLSPAAAAAAAWTAVARHVPRPSRAQNARVFIAILQLQFFFCRIYSLVYTLFFFRSEERRVGKEC